MEGRELLTGTHIQRTKKKHMHSLRAEMNGTVLILPMAEIDGLILEESNRVRTHVSMVCTTLAVLLSEGPNTSWCSCLDPRLPKVTSCIDSFSNNLGL